jgi:hypothetical protein
MLSELLLTLISYVLRGKFIHHKYMAGEFVKFKKQATDVLYKYNFRSTMKWYSGSRECCQCSKLQDILQGVNKYYRMGCMFGFSEQVSLASHPWNGHRCGSWLSPIHHQFLIQDSCFIHLNEMTFQECFMWTFYDSVYVCTHFITVLYLYIFHFLIKQLQSVWNRKYLRNLHSVIPVPVLIPGTHLPHHMASHPRKP